MIEYINIELKFCEEKNTCLMWTWSTINI